MRPPAERLKALGPHFGASLDAQVETLQDAGEDVIRLDVGSPDLPPSRPIVQALCAAAERPDRHGYQTRRDLLPLRQCWAAMYGRQYGVNLDAEAEVLPVLGSKEAIFHLMQAWVGPGDVVLVPDPAYPTYARAAGFAGAETCLLPLRVERGYLPDLEAVPAETAARAKVLWLNYPNNPTGALAPVEFLAEAVAFARRYNLLVCHDAAYARVTFDGASAPSLLQVPGAIEVAVEFNTLSKSHNMAGWRVGAVVGNRQALAALGRLKANADSGHFLPVLEAASAALTGDQAWLEARNAVYCLRRDLIVTALRELGVAVELPRGSLYVWFPVPERWTSAEFAQVLLQEAHVSLAPGSAFGAQGEGYMRLSLGASTERVVEAIGRIRRWWHSRSSP